MIDLNGKLRTIQKDGIAAYSSSIGGRAITHKIHVHPDGTGLDGSTWDKAFTTIPAAMAAASTDANDLTLILLAPHATYYDIDTTGDPTYTGNYEIVGSHRLWSLIRNTHASATSIMKFTEKISLRDLAIFQTGNTNGVIFTQGGSRIRQCGFNSEGLTGAATSICYDGTSGVTRGCIIDDIQMLGESEFTKGIQINQSKINEFHNMHMRKCRTGIQIIGAASEGNTFQNCDIGDCDHASGIGIDLDAGSDQFFNNITFHHNTTNVSDATAGDSVWNNIQAELDVTLEPDDFTGVTVATHANAGEWTTVPVEVRAAATSTTPFKIVATLAEGNAAEKFRVRFSADSAVTWFDDISVESTVNAIKREASAAPTATDHIFNAGTQIVASAKSESGGNSIQIWIEIQEI